MSNVVGRYAPSPSGPLHFGSLLAAVASFCQARSQGGLWRLRIDDLDACRGSAEFVRDILQTLAAYGLQHDGSVMFQSERGTVYARHLAMLRDQGLTFDCACTRREAHRGPPGLEGRIYTGRCREGLPPGRVARSVRFRVDARRVTLTDRIQGDYAQNLATDIGDFIVRRADGVTAYQLATVVDDAAQGVTEVVRGADLLSSTPRQMALGRALGFETPTYAHVPVVVDAEGEKLAKRNGALALSCDRKARELTECLVLLGQNPPPRLAARSVASVLRWAVEHWSLDAVPRQARCQRPA